MVLKGDFVGPKVGWFQEVVVVVFTSILTKFGLGTDRRPPRFGNVCYSLTSGRDGLLDLCTARRALKSVHHLCSPTRNVGDDLSARRRLGKAATRRRGE